MASVIPPDPATMTFIDGDIPEPMMGLNAGPSKWQPIFEALKKQPDKWAIVRRYGGDNKLAGLVASQIRGAAKPKHAFEVAARGDTVYARARNTGE